MKGFAMHLTSLLTAAGSGLVAASGVADWRSEGFSENVGLEHPSIRFSIATPVADAAVLQDGTLAFSLRDEEGQTRRFNVLVEGAGAWSAPKGMNRLPDNVRVLDDDSTARLIGRYHEVVMRAADADVTYRLRRSEGGAPEQVFEIEPGADAEALALRFDGVAQVAEAPDGTLKLGMDAHELIWSAPKAWQYGDDGQTLPVTVSYRVAGRKASFDFGRYDHKRTLHVDPFLARTYHGGSNDEAAWSLLESFGDVYVAGSTASRNFPGMGSPPQSQWTGFVTRFSGDLSTRLATLIIPESEGGGGIGIGNPIQLDARSGSSDVYIAWRGSPGSSMPLRVRRFNSSLTTVMSSIDVPMGEGMGEITSMRVNSGSGDVYVAIADHILNNYLEPIQSRVLRIASNFSSVLADRRLPLTVRGGLVVRETAPFTVHLAGIHPEEAYFEYVGYSPSFLSRTGVVIESYSADLTSIGRYEFAVDGTLLPAGLAYDNDRNEVLLFGSTTAQQLPSGAEAGARPSSIGRTDAFAARYSLLFGLRATTFLGSLGNDGIYSANVSAHGVHVLGQSCVDASLSAAEQSILLGLDGASMLRLRSFTGNRCDNFLTQLSPDLSRVVRSTWLEAPSDIGIIAQRRGLRGGPADNTLAIVGRVSAGLELDDDTFTMPGAVQPHSGGGVDDIFVETVTKDLAAAVVLPGGSCENTATTNCGAAIPNNSPFNNWLDSNKPVLGCGYVRGIRVGLDVAHTWIGDLTVSLHAPDGTSRLLLDRPGAPALSPDGCGSDNLRVVFDDRAANDSEGTCADAPPATHSMLGDVRPSQSLAGFAGRSADGAWRLRVVDSSAGNAGTLQDWSLEIDCSPTPLADADLEATFVSLTAPGVGNAIVPGMPFSWTARVRNLGPATINGARLESDLRGNFSNVSFSCMPTSAGAACVTPTGSTGLVQADVNLGVNATAEITITATPAATMDSPLIVGYADVYRPSSLGAIGLDPNAANDHVQWIAPIHRVADLAVIPLGVPVPAAPGTITTFQFAVQNAGPSRVLDALVRLLPLEKLAVESLVCWPGASAGASAATYAIHADIEAMLSPDSEGFVLCDAALRISSLALPGDTARVAFSVGGSGHTDGASGNNSREHHITVIAASPFLFADGFE
jgi:subtilisin-like proprotein convertase family protein